MRTSGRNAFLLVAAGAGVLLACVAAAAPIEGREWRLSELRGQDAQTLASLRERVTVRFEAGQLQAFAGCNRLAGGYTIEGDRVRIGVLAGTMMACPEPAMSIEAAFKEACAGVLDVRVEGERLSLASATDAGPRMVFEVAPAPVLEGITWQISGFNNGRQAVVSPLTGTSLSVSFENGSVVGDAGCNRFRATYERDGSRLRIGSVAATRKACEAEGVMEQERQLLAAIESATTWAIDRGMLDLHRADGERVLTAHPLAK